MATLAACTATGQSAPLTIVPDAETGRVIHVNDGDTIDVEIGEGQVTVRLAAINAPELGECFHEEALDHLAQNLEGRTVRLESLGADQFERNLAHVFIDDRHVNLEMVSTGLALASTPEADDPYGPALLAAEEQAYSSGTGLWARGACGNEQAEPGLAIEPARSVPDPEGPDQEVIGSESIVIVNQLDFETELTGWVLRDESSRHRHTFPEDATIAPGQSWRVTSADPGWAPGGEPVWNNDGDMALLLDPAGNVVSRWRY